VDSVDLDVLARSLAWLESGRRVVIATVVHSWGSAPRPPGAWLAIRDDAQVAGSVSGGCIEDDLIRRVGAGEFAAAMPRVVSYGVSKEEATRFGLPCGGTLQLVIEPNPRLTELRELARRIERRELTARRLDLATGRVTLAPACRGDALRFDGRSLVTVHGPRLRLLIIGAGQLSRYLAEMALALDYAVIVCDPRTEYADGWSVGGVELLTGMPDDVVLAIGADPHTAIVALTHDPKLDDMALLEALKSPAFYVGALGSRANTAKRKQRLREHFDLSEAELARLHGPVGLPIGSRTPPEIAVSILAEMTAVKNGVGSAQPAPGSPAASVRTPGCGVA